MFHFQLGKAKLFMNDTKKKNLKFLWILPILLGGILLYGYFYQTNGWFLPNFITWTNLKETITFGNETVDVTLKNKKLTISKDGKLLYETPDDYFVSNVFCFDVDRDSNLDICMMLWKKGSFGDHKPFWITKDSTDYSQHIFLYHYDEKRDDRLDPFWMSSDMGIDAASMSIDEYGRIHLIDKNNIETRWAWLRWGLVNCD